MSLSVVTASSPSPSRDASFANSEKIETAVVRRCREPALGKSNLIGAGVEEARRHPLAIRNQFGCGLGEQSRRVAHRAAGMRAAAETDDVGVAGDHIDHFHRDQYLHDCGALAG